jgi:peptidoglycan DL-endopeptidase CwlO
MAPESYDDLIGKPYELGATGPAAYDCYGLVVEVLSRLGFTINTDLAAEWIRMYQPGLIDPEDITELECEIDETPRKPGDLIIMRADPSEGRATHVAVHIGKNLVMQSTRKIGVHVVPFRVLEPMTVEVITWTE